MGLWPTTDYLVALQCDFKKSKQGQISRSSQICNLQVYWFYAIMAYIKQIRKKQTNK